MQLNFLSQISLQFHIKLREIIKSFGKQESEEGYMASCN